MIVFGTMIWREPILSCCCIDVGKKNEGRRKEEDQVSFPLLFLSSFFSSSLVNE